MKKESTVVPKPVITDDSESSAVISPDSVQSGNAESGLQDSDLPESCLTETEHKKVAMRLSSEAVDKLQKFRANTGVPYEILVEVMIRNWENLPQRTQSSYLQQAKQLRVNRLMAGQEKTLKTMKAKYLQP